MPPSAFAVLLGLSCLVGVVVALGLASLLSAVLKDWRATRNAKSRDRKIRKAREAILRREQRAAEAYIERVKEYYNGIG